jgi:hypothetical protein
VTDIPGDPLDALVRALCQVAEWQLDGLWYEEQGSDERFTEDAIGG